MMMNINVITAEHDKIHGERAEVTLIPTDHTGVKSSRQAEEHAFHSRLSNKKRGADRGLEKRSTETVR